MLNVRCFPRYENAAISAFGHARLLGLAIGFLAVGAIMGAVLESAGFIRARWDLAAEDFRRIWNFCMLLVLALVVFSFAANQENGGFTGLLHSSAAEATRSVGLSATAFLRWLPTDAVLLIAVQTFNEREAIPLSAISFFALRRRKAGVAERYVNVSYPYFIVCLFSAAFTPNQATHTYFFGQAFLIVWALWFLRSRRFGIATWLGALVLVVGIAYVGHLGIGQVRQMLAGYNMQWMARFMRQRTDSLVSITSIGQIGELNYPADRHPSRTEGRRRNRRNICGKPATGSTGPRCNRGCRAFRKTNEFDPLQSETDPSTWLFAARPKPTCRRSTCVLSSTAGQGN